jgi:hypothetical protein
MCNNLKIHVNPKNNLFYINDDDAIKCTMRILSTYKKFVFMEFNKKCYNSNLHIQFDIVIFYFDVYISISIDFMFKVQTHVQQFENICKP